MSLCDQFTTPLLCHCCTESPLNRAYKWPHFHSTLFLQTSSKPLIPKFMDHCQACQLCLIWLFGFQVSLHLPYHDKSHKSCLQLGQARAVLQNSVCDTDWNQLIITPLLNSIWNSFIKKKTPVVSKIIFTWCHKGWWRTNKTGSSGFQCLLDLQTKERRF